MSINYNYGWIKDENGVNFAPNTIIDKVLTPDGGTLTDELAYIQNDIIAKNTESKEYIDTQIATEKSERETAITNLETTVKEYTDTQISNEVTARTEAITNLETTVTEKITQAVEGSVKDWNQNDETVADYIKNRTHYENIEIIEDIFVPEQTANFNGNNYTLLTGSKALDPYVGYTISIDGTESYMVTTGSATSMDLRLTDIGYIIHCEVANDGSYEYRISCNNSEIPESITISIKTKSETLVELKQLDEKFIPDTIARTEYVDTAITEAKTYTDTKITETLQSNYDLWLSLGYEGTPNDFIEFLRGDSAYELWLKQEGNEGKTEEEFLSSMDGVTNEELDQTLTDAKAYTDEALSNIKVENADWNTNDESAASYVKNRTHWVSDPIETVLVDNETITIEEHGVIDSVSISNFEITVGNTYKVIIDGIGEYECIAYCPYTDAPIYIGDTAVYGAQFSGGNGEPFCIIQRNNYTEFAMSSNEVGNTYTISISEIKQDIYKLDEKYLPNNNITNGSAKGSIRTIGSKAEDDTYTIGEYGFSEGSLTEAAGTFSHAEGYLSKASGDVSHAEGYGTSATEQCAHAEGYDTVASGMYSHAEGKGTIAASDAQHVQGTYNIEDAEAKYIHIVGNGNYDSARSNAHTLDKDGNAWYAGDVLVGGTSQDDASKLATEEFVNNSVSNVNIVKDWNTNDESAASYIKNRTHWTDDPVEEVQITNIEVTVTTNGALTRASLPGVVLYKNQSYTITVNSTTYEFEGASDGPVGSIIIGDVSYMGGGSTDNDIPFCITGNEGRENCVFYVANTHDGETYTISVSTYISQVHPLDEKFIPDTIARTEYVDNALANISDIDTTDFNGMTVTDTSGFLGTIDASVNAQSLINNLMERISALETSLASAVERLSKL